MLARGLVLACGVFVGAQVHGQASVGKAAPLFKTKDHRGADFDLAKRGGHWTVLYFYPKAETPGCTKQACAFRDKIQVIRKLGAEVYGISTDDVAKQADFHRNHKLNFDLLADPDAKVAEAYGTKMPLVKISKRRTFVIDPSLVVRAVDVDVDPAADPDRVATQVGKLQAADQASKRR